jgi:hypothetical protein
MLNVAVGLHHTTPPGAFRQPALTACPLRCPISRVPRVLTTWIPTGAHSQSTTTTHQHPDSVTCLRVWVLRQPLTLPDSKRGVPGGSHFTSFCSRRQCGGRRSDIAFTHQPAMSNVPRPTSRARGPRTPPAGRASDPAPATLGQGAGAGSEKEKTTHFYVFRPRVWPGSSAPCTARKRAMLNSP